MNSQNIIIKTIILTFDAKKIKIKARNYYYNILINKQEYSSYL